MVEITRRQMDLLDFVKRFQAIHNKNPSLATIARGIKTSTSSVTRIIARLVESGVIEHDHYARRYKIISDACLKTE